MINAQGQTEFCPGCTISGNYLGPIAEDMCFYDGEVGSNYHGMFCLVDENGTNSLPIEYTRVLTGSFSNPNDEAINDGIRKTETDVYKRIGRCTKGVVSVPSECPAFNREVLCTLLTKNIQGN